MTARLTDPAELLTDAPAIRSALDRTGWSSQAVEELLGATAHTHLDREELAPLIRRLRDSGPLGTVVRLFILGLAVDGDEAQQAGIPASWLRRDGTAAVRLQAIRHDDREVTVVHDPARLAPGAHPEQVLGVGQASLTLAGATPRRPVTCALDLGSGSGIQALLLSQHAGEVVATDSNPRAVLFTRLGAALNGVALDSRLGPSLSPVANEKFDLVVCNPPYVVSPTPRYTYRDSGVAGDEFCRRLVEDLPAVLAPGGIAVVLLNWLHLEGQSGDDRVRGWLSGSECDAWVVQRELAAPADYVTAWLRDADEGARFDVLYDEWMDWFDRHRVEAVAFGILALRRRATGRPSVVVDDVSQPVAATWGEQVLAHFASRDALTGDVLAVPWRLREDVRLQQVAARGGAGWELESALLVQTQGLRWTVRVDEHAAALLAGCDGSVPLRTLFTVLAAAADIPVNAAVEGGLPAVLRLVEQGFLVP